MSDPPPAKATIDPRRDIWGALISEQASSTPKATSSEHHLLFVGSEGCGKTTLQNSFFGRTEDGSTTLALSYQSCSIGLGSSSDASERCLHFWELGGGSKLEKLLNTIITPENQVRFSVFICVDLSRPKSIQTAVELTPLVMNRLKNASKPGFFVGTHYEGFEPEDPSYKSQIIGGLRGVGRQYGLGLVVFSPKVDSLISRFRALINSIVRPDAKRPETVVSHTGPTLVYGNSDDDVGGGAEAVVRLRKLLQSSDSGEAEKTAPGLQDPAKDEMFGEEDIDKLVQVKERELEDKLRILRATLSD
jgi:energy-coupling factor transporter ATP-binding protein EcfA2